MSYYAYVKNSSIERINITLPTSIGNTSIGANATDLDQLDLYPITGDEPIYDPLTQRLQGPTYVFTGNSVERVFTVEDIPQEEIFSRVQTEIVQSTQERLDNFARTRNYSDILSACTYATSSVPKFKIEGQYCVDSRDQTWAKLYEIMNDVQSGKRPPPTGYADIESELPILEWPNT